MVWRGVVSWVGVGHDEARSGVKAIEFHKMLLIRGNELCGMAVLLRVPSRVGYRRLPQVV